MVDDTSRSPEPFKIASKTFNFGISSTSSACLRRAGSEPPSASRRAIMYLNSSLSSGNLKKGKSAISSSLTGILKRSR